MSPATARTAFNSSLTVLVLVVLASCSVPILHDVDEPEANGVLAALQRHGIAAEKQRIAQGSKATYVIEVKRSDAPRAWQILRQQNLPRRAPKGLGEVFGKPTLVPTAQQERALMRHALSGEVTNTLQSVEGVRQARVHIVIPHRNPLAPPDSKRELPRAAVLLKVDGKSPLSVEQIKRLVAGSVEGLDPARVSVVISNQIAKPLAESSKISLVSVGPFSVASSSQSALLVTLSLLLVLLLGVSLGMLFVVVRYRALKRRAAEEQVRPSAQLEASLSMLDRSFHRSTHTNATNLE